MKVSNCCGAEIKSSSDGWNISCACCSTILDICKDTIDQDEPSIVILELPEEEELRKVLDNAETQMEKRVDEMFERIKKKNEE